ncbi:MAG: hypothetical protein K2K97_05285, partial [Muribaculaceae bacterium]|nr:hypothetical protein [Muribaculaceae bacterium]
LSVCARSLGLEAVRVVIMKWRYGREPKRAFIEFTNDPKNKMQIQHLTIEESEGVYTQEYRELCKDFYLKF